jgi:hypothetical protein
MYTLYNKNIYNQKAKMAELVDAKASKAFIYTKCDEFKSLSSYVKKYVINLLFLRTKVLRHKNFFYLV